MRNVTVAVVARLAGAQPSSLLERLDDALRADERAREVRADLDQVLPDRLEVEHVVERRDRAAVGGRQLERVGDLADRVRRAASRTPPAPAAAPGSIAERAPSG